MEGDGVSEGVLNDIGMPSLPGVRSPIVESVFEYGSRVGGWRLLRLFRRFGVKVCLLAVAKAAEGEMVTFTYDFPKPGTKASALKETLEVRVGKQACGVSYFKS